MPNSFKVTSIVRRVTLGVALAALAIGNGTNAMAAQNGGNFRTGTCGTGASTFVTLVNGQATYGFNGTSAAAQLGQSGSGAAGLILNFHYANAQPTQTNDFRLLSLDFNDGESKGAKKTVTLRYCFQADHGDGKTVEYSTTLNKLSATGIGNGFKNVVQNAQQFGGLNVRAMVLRRLTITVADDQPSNITIGDTALSIAASEFHPVGINLTPAGCNAIYDCPDTVVLTK